MKKQIIKYVAIATIIATTIVGTAYKRYQHRIQIANNNITNLTQQGYTDMSYAEGAGVYFGYTPNGNMFIVGDKHINEYVK